MRATVDLALQLGRISKARGGKWGSDESAGLNGAFEAPGPGGWTLRIIANTADRPDAVGWEHVSVSTESRCPTWDEMCFVKNLFWEPNECVVQFHPPASDYVNCHPFCLHMWRSVRFKFALPPTFMVGPKP